MALKVERLQIDGLTLVTPDRLADGRGFFSETWNARSFAAAGLTEVYVQDNHSCSSEMGTVRGLHFQRPPHAQAKLVRVCRGRALDVAVDLRKGSPTFGHHVAVELSAENGLQFLLPVGFAHGFCTLEPMTEVIYKVTDYYAPECDAGILWSDPALGIAWPAAAGSVVSAKDAALPRLAEIKTPFVYVSSGEGA